MRNRRDALQCAGRQSSVQAESRLRVSGEGDVVTAALVRAARRAAELQKALHVTIHDSTASTRAIADAAGISYQFLCNAANDSLREQLPFLRLPLVLEACDDLTLLRFLAALQGADVIRLPAAAAGDVRQASATMREFAEFMDAGAAALENNHVSPEEFADIEREGLEAVRAIFALIAHYRGRVDRPLLEGLR